MEADIQIKLNILKDLIIGIYEYENNLYLITSYNKENNTLNAVNVTQGGAINTTYNMPILEHFELFPE